MPKASREELVEASFKIRNNIFRVMLPTVPREVLVMDFTMPQLKAMFLLFLNGPMRMSDLAADLGVTLATSTGVIDRLVERKPRSSGKRPRRPARGALPTFGVRRKRHKPDIWNRRLTGFEVFSDRSPPATLRRFLVC